jgi:hypothetical protein
MTRGEAVRLAGALLLGAGVALPAGMWLAHDAQRAPARQAAADRRAMFSPDVRGDPYVREQFRSQVEALEGYCRDSGAMCAEAKAARIRYEELAQ